jgi:type III secretory pathway lipoprotein EscJ
MGLSSPRNGMSPVTHAGAPGLRPSHPTRLLPRCALALVLCLLAACRAGESVATVVNESEATEILTVLYEHRIEGRKEEFGEEGARRWRVLVGAGDVASANQVLQDYGLPRPSDQGREGARDSGLFQTDSAEKARRLKEIETEIERQLRLLPGVVRVKVNVSPAAGDLLELNPPPATASVVIVCKDKQPTFTDENVRKLVAGGAPKLKPENVTVAVAYEPPRFVAGRESGGRRSVVLKFALISAAVLCLLLGALIALHLRRQRGRQAGAPNGEGELPGEAPASLPDPGARRLNAGQKAAQASASGSAAARVE